MGLDYIPTYILGLIVDAKEQSVEQRWEMVKEALVGLLEYRIESSSQEWYVDKWNRALASLHRVSYSDLKYDRDGLRRGPFGELFFLEACHQIGLDCTVSSGDDDLMLGWDVGISFDGETRFCDVTINTSNGGYFDKTDGSSFPTLFIPWQIQGKNGRPSNVTYLDRYVLTGEFDAREFLNRVVSLNFAILRELESVTYGRIDILSSERAKRAANFSEPSPRYVQSLEAVLRMIRRKLG